MARNFIPGTIALRNTVPVNVGQKHLGVGGFALSAVRIFHIIPLYIRRQAASRFIVLVSARGRPPAPVSKVSARNVAKSSGITNLRIQKAKFTVRVSANRRQPALGQSAHGAARNFGIIAVGRGSIALASVVLPLMPRTILV